MRVWGGSGEWVPGVGVLSGVWSGRIVWEYGEGG